MVMLPIVIAAINLVVAYQMRRRSNAPNRRGWPLLARLIGLFLITTTVWFIAAVPYGIGFTDSHASFDSYARTIQGTNPSPLDNNYIQYQRFLEREHLFMLTLG